MALTKFAEDLLLLVARGEQDFGVEALGLKALPGRGLGAGSVSGFHLDVQVDLEQVWVLLLDVTGIQVIPGSTTDRLETGTYGGSAFQELIRKIRVDIIEQAMRKATLWVTDLVQLKALSF